MLADISTGNTGTADVFFLVALILFVVAAVAYATTSVVTKFAASLVALGLASVSLAWLVL